TNTVLMAPTVTTLGSGTTVFTANFSGFSRFFLVDDVVILSAELTEFSGKLTTEQNSLLTWTTASEQNNRQFDIELSRNGIDFEVIGTVASKGNSITDQHYEFLHVKPQPGISYYRLKQTDHDGKYTYSKIISVTVNPELTRAFVYPVPAKNMISINFGTVANKGEISIYSADMKLVKTERINGPLLTKEIYISNLAKGMYFIRFTQGKIIKTFPFIKD
ncbi:MAG TPA: T9SS type A sorting domain-containing protein, partial [Chryseolinea sp.]|nr:T9SS type A sorting domain-containing protein [Chryseolinea sp.]